MDYSGWAIAALAGFALVFSALAAIWKVFVVRIERLETDQEKTLSKEQFGEFKENMLSRHDAADQRLAVIEQTRPTTGELSALIGRAGKG